MAGLSNRRPASISTTVTTVLRGMINDTLCIIVADSERAFVLKQIVPVATVCFFRNSVVAETLP
jgi:hypothetical protein